MLQPKHLPNPIRPHPILTFYQHATSLLSPGRRDTHGIPTLRRRVSPRSRVPSQDCEILLLDHNCGSCTAEIITRSLHVSARAMTLHGFRGLQTGESARHVSEDEEDVGWRGGETLTRSGRVTACMPIVCFL